MSLFNNDWKNFVEKGEKIISFSEIPTKFSIIYSFFASLFLTFFVFIFYIAELGKSFTNSSFIYLITAVLFFAFLNYLRCKSFKYIITNKNIIEIHGLIMKSYIYVPYSKITDTRLHRNLFDLILKTGSVSISTAGGTTRNAASPYEIKFLHINNFMKINADIKKLIK